MKLYRFISLVLIASLLAGMTMAFITPATAVALAATLRVPAGAFLSGDDPTPDPNAMPSYQFKPDELDATGCMTGDAAVTAYLRNSASEEKDYALGVKLGYSVDRGAEYVSAVAVEPDYFARIDAGEKVQFNVYVKTTKDFVGSSDEIKVRVFVASAINRPDHLYGRLTVTLEGDEMDGACPTKTITPTPTKTTTVTPTDTTTVTPTDTTTVTPTDTTTVTPTDITPTTVTPTDTTTVTPTDTTTTTVTPTDTTTVTPTDTTTVTPTDTNTVTVTVTETTTGTPTVPVEFYCLSVGGPSNAYLNNFDEAAPGTLGWDVYKDAYTPAGQHFLGPYNSETLTFKLACLPEHTVVHLEFDLYIIQSWEGSTGPNSPDFWNLTIDGKPVIHTTFTNYTNGQQAFPNNYPDSSHPGPTGALALNSLGYKVNGTGMDAVYHITLDVPHTAGDLTVAFSGAGLQPVTDESWGLDNFTTKTFNYTHPIYMPMLALNGK